MSFDITELNKLYQQQKIVPLIGAGLSLPFKLPSWGKLIELLMKKQSMRNIMKLYKSL